MEDTVTGVDDLVAILVAQGIEGVFTVVVTLVVQPIIGQFTKDEKERFVQPFNTHQGTAAESFQVNNLWNDHKHILNNTQE